MREALADLDREFHWTATGRIAELERELAVAREQVEHDRTELEAMVAESARAAIVRLEAIAAKLAAVTKTKA